MKKFLCITSLIIATICSFSNVDCVDGIGYIKILPWLYLVCMVLSRSNTKMMNGPGMTMLNLIMFIRYTILPLSICINNDVSKYAKNYNYISHAVFIMSVEMVFIFFTLGAIKYRNRPEKSYVFSEIIFSELTNNVEFILFGVTVIAGIIATNRNIIGSVTIIIGGSVQNDVTNNASGLTMMIWKGMITFFYVYVLARIKSRSYTDSKKIVLSILLSLLYEVFMYIGQASIARWFLLASAIIILYMLTDMYPNYKISVGILVALPILCLLVSASITKNTSLVGNYGFIDAFKELISPQNMDSYFAGPVSVNNAIGMKLNVEVSILNLPYDLLNNFPGIADSIDKTKVTNKIFNTFLFGSNRSDQILPLVGQSFSLFTFLGTPVLSILATRLVVYFDKKYYEAKTLMCYCYGFCGVWVGISMVLNLTICISWFYSVIIPLYVIIWCYERVTLKKRWNKK